MEVYEKLTEELIKAQEELRILVEEMGDHWSGEVYTQMREEGLLFSDSKIPEITEQTIALTQIYEEAMQQAVLLNDRCGKLGAVMRGEEPSYPESVLANPYNYDGKLSINTGLTEGIISDCQEVRERSREIETITYGIENCLQGMTYEPLDITTETAAVRASCAKINRIEDYARAYRKFAEGMEELDENLKAALAPYVNPQKTVTTAIYEEAQTEDGINVERVLYLLNKGIDNLNKFDAKELENALKSIQEGNHLYEMELLASRIVANGAESFSDSEKAYLDWYMMTWQDAERLKEFLQGVDVERLEKELSELESEVSEFKREVDKAGGKLIALNGELFENQISMRSQGESPSQIKIPNPSKMKKLIDELKLAEEAYERINEIYQGKKEALAYVKEYQRQHYYEELPKREDFEEKSVYKGKPSGGMDIDYEYLNDQQHVREVVRIRNNGENKQSRACYDYITEEELKIYNYLYVTEGKERAKAYISDIQDVLSYRRAMEEVEKLGGNTALQVGYGVKVGLDTAYGGVESLINACFSNEPVPTSYIQMAGGMIREDLNEKGDQFLGRTWRAIVYDNVLGLTTATPGIVLGLAVGPVAGTAYSAVITTGNVYNQSLQQGYSQQQAWEYALAMGGTGAVLDYCVGGIPGMGKAATESIKGMEKGVASAVGKNVARSMFQNYVENVGIDPFYKQEFLGEETPFVFMNEEIASSMLDSFIQSAGMNIGAAAITKLSQSNQKGKVQESEESASPTVIDYTNRFNDSLTDDFNIGYEVRNVVQEDMILVQYSSDAPNASLRYWTTVDEANAIITVQDYMNKMALSEEWGNRDVIKVARINNGTEVMQAIGTAKAQPMLIDPRPGNGKQILFSKFDTNWVTEIRKFSN